MTDVNIPLLRKAVEWVEEQDKKPEADSQWFQGDWIVNERLHAYNLARIAVSERRDVLYDRGEEMTYEESEYLTELAAYWLANTCGTAYCVAGYVAQLQNEKYATCSRWQGATIEHYAQRALGLDDAQAGQLFSGGNTAADVRFVAETIAGERL